MRHTATRSQSQGQPVSNSSEETAQSERGAELISARGATFAHSFGPAYIAYAAFLSTGRQIYSLRP
jgi:hypothetical protein